MFRAIVLAIVAISMRDYPTLMPMAALFVIGSLG